MCAAAVNAQWRIATSGRRAGSRPGNCFRGAVGHLAWLATAGCLVLAVASLGSVQANTPALASVTRLVSALDELSAQQGLSDKELAARFGDLATRHFNIPTMARGTLGASVSAIPKAQWPEFVSAYRNHLQAAFVAGTRRHGASTSKVLGSRTAPNGLPVIVTRTKIDGRTRDTVWFMCRSDTARVCDIGVDGVRASARQRSVFRPVLIRDGPDAFLARLAEGKFATEGDLQP